MVIRFEFWENVNSKSTLHGATWQQAAKAAYLQHLDAANWTIVQVRQLDPDTLEILKRRNANIGFLARAGVFSTENVYQRVTINRAEKSTAVDRLDANYHYDAPFVGRRDFFFEGNDGKLAFVRHDLWIHKVFKLQALMKASWAASSYKKAFKAQTM